MGKTYTDILMYVKKAESQQVKQARAHTHTEKQPFARDKVIFHTRDHDP